MRMRMRMHMHAHMCMVTCVPDLAGGGLQSDTAALKALQPAAMPDKTGRRTEKIMEDVWLGSLLYRSPPPQPITYVNLLHARTGLIVDAWDFRLTRSALLVHVITKQMDRLLALHAYMHRADSHCSRPFRLKCEPHQRRVPTYGHSADQWCQVEPFSRSEGGVQPCCATAGPRKRNASCSAVFGSNRWTAPFKKAASRFSTSCSFSTAQQAQLCSEAVREALPAPASLLTT